MRRLQGVWAGVTVIIEIDEVRLLISSEGISRKIFEKGETGIRTEVMEFWKYGVGVEIVAMKSRSEL